MTAELPMNAPSPRLCHIVKWPDFDGYGFNLHADKSRPGQYIGKVDEDSPADVAGLREGDRIIEVNGVNISNENHKQVVQRIKAVSNETKLLVVDGEADRWYKNHNLVVRNDQANIIYGSSQKTSNQASPKTPVQNENSRPHEEDSKSVASSSSSHSEQSTQPQQTDNANDIDEEVKKEVDSIASLTLEEDKPVPATPAEDQHSSEVPLDSDLSLEYDNIRFEQEENAKGPKNLPEERHSLSSRSSEETVPPSKAETEKAEEDGKSLPDTEPDEEDRKSPMSTTPSPPPSLNPEGNNATSKHPTTQNSSPTPPKNNYGLNLNMTAAEMRAHLASKKKVDPRKDTIDLKKKYQIVQNM